MRKKFIPTINISKFKLKNNNSNNKKILNQIQRACIEVGFFQIVGHRNWFFKIITARIKIIVRVFFKGTLIND